MIDLPGREVAAVAAAAELGRSAREKRSMSRGFWIVLFIAVTATLFFMAVLRSFTPAGRQQYNMAVAEKELPRIRAILAATFDLRACRRTSTLDKTAR